MDSCFLLVPILFYTVSVYIRPYFILISLSLVAAALIPTTLDGLPEYPVSSLLTVVPVSLTVGFFL